jgi:hypothetical protein
VTEHGINLAALAQDRGSHSVFAPSASPMWMGCSGSLIPNLLAPDTAGRDAAEGTVGHYVGETWLKSGKRPTHLIGTVEWVEEGDWGFLIEIDEVMLDFVQQYVDWCELLPGDHYVEQRVYFSQITPIPNQGGTADHVVCRLHVMIITDLKYGKGIWVFAENNSQLLLYALGFFYEWDWLYDFQTIVIRVAQPRLNNFDEWTITREELLAFAEYARERAHAAWVIDAPRTPSEKACQWCNVKATCTANAKLQIDLMAAAFDDLGAPVTHEQMEEFVDDLALTVIPQTVPIVTLSTEDLAVLYSFRKMAESWWKAVSLELFRRAQLGEPIPGQKLVESRSRRVFRNSEAAAKELKRLGVPESRIWEKKILSPAQAEIELKKKGHRTKDLPNLLSDLVHKPVGKATLAPISDKRVALVDISGIAFEDLSETRESDEDEEY